MPGPSLTVASTPSWPSRARFQRAFAVAAVVLATGGLVLYRTPSSVGAGLPVTVARPDPRPLLADGKNAVPFEGPGARGVLSLSHTKVLAGGTTAVQAELRVVATPGASEVLPVRAPISLAVVLDTSGSMGGDKLEDAKRSVLRLLSDMKDDDEIAVVRYADTSELVQPLARAGEGRRSLPDRIRGLTAGGGTNIPGGLSHGLRAVDEAAKGRVRRIVLVSDGLDGTRVQAESLARTSFAGGITVSSLGIGLDFDESYMGAVAQNGRGNFAFVRDAGSLTAFLERELEQTATTTVENAEVRLALPSGLRFVSATGAEASIASDGPTREVTLRLGSLFAGDARRVIVELEAIGEPADLRASASWNRVGEGSRRLTIPTLTLQPSNDPAEVERGRDGAVLASATSVLASKRQLEASNAYARGDIGRATELATENEAALGAAVAAAPRAAAPALEAQRRAYSDQRKNYAAVQPSSVEGNTARKAGTAADLDNLNRPSSF